MNEAVRLHRSGAVELALQQYERIIAAHPTCSDAAHLAGIICSQQGNHQRALLLLRKAVAAAPNQPTFHNNLGEACRRAGELDAAIASFNEALRQNGGFAEAHFNLANTLAQVGRAEASVEHFQHAIRIQPAYWKAHFHLADVLCEQGLFRSAAGHYEKTLALNPNEADVHAHFASALLELEECGRAIEHFQRAAALVPSASSTQLSLACALLALGRTEEARAALQAYAATDPLDPLKQLQPDAVCAPVVQGNAEIEQFRARMDRALEKAAPSAARISVQSIQAGGVPPPRELAYHGGDVKAFMQRYAALFLDAIPRETLAPRRDKARIGVVVSHGHEGVFAKCMLGILNRISARDQEVSIVCHPAGRAYLGPLLTNGRVNFVVVPRTLSAAAKALREQAFDLLHFWECGTDAFNYFLPFFQLARTQSATWGWPVTTGNPRVRYYVSSEQLEPPEGDGHYSETLVRLPSLPACYARPAVPTGSALKGREHFGFKASEHLYLCAQNLRKYHPDFDALIAAILAGDGDGVFVLFGNKQPLVTQMLLRRLESSLGPALFKRVRALPWMSEPEYLNVLALADVVLDTVHYGAGVNTMYDAIAAARPVVTWPSEFHRGRWGAAALKRAGVVETVASTSEQYVKIALRLGCEADFRRDVSERLRLRGGELFEDAGAVCELEDFFRAATEAKS